MVTAVRGGNCPQKVDLMMRRLLPHLFAVGLMMTIGSSGVHAAEQPVKPSDSQATAPALKSPPTRADLVRGVPMTAEVDRSLEGDKKCTLCHNEASGHVLAIYQTKHGVKGDSRTPGCQGCH